METSQSPNPLGPPLIRLRQVSKAYQTVAGPFLALDGLDLDIYPGEFVGILGKSGAGKSTLINLISGVDHITEGQIWVGDVPVHTLSENQAAAWRGKNLGVIFQSFQLMPTLSLIDNVLLAVDFAGKFRPLNSPNRAMQLLREVEIEEHALKVPALISGGQQQRVAIARALANDPPVILADEPTGRLDTVTAETIFEIFEKLVARGKTVVMVTHDTSFARRFSRLVWLADGRFVDEPQFKID